MVKLNNDIKNKIIQDIENGSSITNIMTNYKISRSTVQRIKNDSLPIEKTESIDVEYSKNEREYISENEPEVEEDKDINDLFNDINNQPKMIEPKMTEPEINQPEIIQPKNEPDMFNNIEAKMRIINSLNSEPKQVNHQMNHQMNDARMNIINNLNKNEPKEIPKKIIVNGTETITF